MTDEMAAAKADAQRQYPRYDAAQRLYVKMMLVADDGSWAGSPAPAWRLALQQTCWIAEALEAAFNEGLQAARNACDIEEADCNTEAERARCRSISTHCLHTMIETEGP